MRIGGVEVNGPCEEILVLPRPTGQDIVIRARAVLSMDEFDKLCPEPTPPVRIVAGGKEPNTDSPGYLDAVKAWSKKRFDYLCLKSLEPSQIEWETVDLEKPSTWGKWQDELKEAGFCTTELNRIQNTIWAANALDEGKLRAAREAFLRGQGAEQARSSGQSIELPNTQSGQPATDSE